MMKTNDIYGWEEVPKDTFSLDDYINMNLSIDMIRYNPNQITKIKKAKEIDFYKDFSFYEVLDSSPIREFPLKFFYNHKTGQFYEVDGTNTPIYTLNDIAFFYDSIKIETINDDSLFSKFKKYIHFFFDNVAGKHGHFYIIETFEEIKKYIKIYYDEDETAFKKAVLAIEKLKQTGQLNNLETVIQTTLIAKSNAGEFKIKKGHINIKNKDEWFKIENNEKIIFIFNTYMIFKGNLFNSNIEISNNISKSSDKTLGLISLKNEQVILPERYIKNANGSETQVITGYEKLGFKDDLPPFHIL